MKKLLSVLLTVCLLFSMVTVAAVSVGAAETSVAVGADTTTLTLKPNSDWLSSNAADSEA